MNKKLLPLCFAAFFTMFFCAHGGKKQKAEAFGYLFSSSFEFTGQKKGYFQKNSGLIEMTLVPYKNSTKAYVFAGKARMTVGNDLTSGEASSPTYAVIRDPDNRRIVGGQDNQQAFADIANAAMSQIKDKIVADNRWRRVELRLSHKNYYPKKINFLVKYQAVQSRQLGECVLGIAESSPYICRLPNSKRLITGVFKTVTLGSPGLHRLYFKNAGFTARRGDEQINIRETYWLMRPGFGGKTVDLSDIKPLMERALSVVYLPGNEDIQTNDAPPEWGVHALAIREFMDIAAGAALEGRPNAVVILSVAGIMAVDALTGVGTELLSMASEKVFGYKTPVWAGLTNYIGQGGGWIMARGYSALTGNQLSGKEVDDWMKVGGGMGDVAGLFIPTGAGRKLVTEGGKWTWKAIKIADAGDDVLKFGRHVMSKKTADAIGDMANYYKKLKALWGLKANLPNGIGGGVLLEGVMSGKPVRSVEYNAARHEFIINGRARFAPAVSRQETARMFMEVAAGDQVGISLAGEINGAVATATPVCRNLRKYDEYFGNLLFGSLRHLPAGCQAKPGFQPEQADIPANSLCILFTVNANLELKKDRLNESCQNFVCFIPVKPEKSRYGIWEVELRPDLPAAYRHNFRHLQEHAAFYKNTRIAKTIADYAGIAAFARGLKKAGFDLRKIADKLTVNHVKTIEKFAKKSF